MALPNIIQQINSKVPITGNCKITGGNLIIEGGYNNLQLKTSSNSTYTDIAFLHTDNIRKGFIRSTVGDYNQELSLQVVDVVDGSTKYYSSLILGYNKETNNSYARIGDANIITSKGGTFNGNLNFSTSAGVIRDVGGTDTENKPLYQLSLGFETHEKLGGYIILRRGDSTAYNQAGMCALCASSPDGTRKYLFCFPDGRLLWDNSKVLTEADKTLITQWGLPNYNGIISGIGSTYTAPHNGFVSFNKSGTGNATVNGITVYLGGNDAYNEGNVTLYLKKGDTIVMGVDVGTICFVPLYHGG